MVEQGMARSRSAKRMVPQLAVEGSGQRLGARESATEVDWMERSHCWPGDCAGGMVAGGLFAVTWIGDHALPLEMSVLASAEEALSKTSELCVRDPYP